MSIWLFIWIVLSGALAAFSGWSFYISYVQKKAWRRFAAKHKLRFGMSKMLSSPEITGSFEGYTIGVLTGEHATPDARATRKLTAVEVALKTKMPFAGAIGSGGMVPLVQSLDFGGEVHPEHESWDASYVARARNKPAMEGYLTKERLDVLASLMKIKNFWVIFVFQDEGTLLRVDTTDPLQDMEKLEKLIKKMISAVRKLELMAGEEERLLSLKAEKEKPAKKKSAVLDAPVEEKIELELELEEDEDE